MWGNDHLFSIKPAKLQDIRVPGTERLVTESCTLVILTGARMGSVELVKFERIMMQILGKF